MQGKSMPPEAARLTKKLVTQKGSLGERELSAKLTEGLFYEMFLILSCILQILNFSFTTPPSKIIDFCHGRKSSKCNTGGKDLRRRKPIEAFSGTAIDEMLNALNISI